MTNSIYQKENVATNSYNEIEKPLEFEYQKEFRVYVENDKIESIKMQIGSMKDYAENV